MLKVVKEKVILTTLNSVLSPRRNFRHPRCCTQHSEFPFPSVFLKEQLAEGLSAAPPLFWKGHFQHKENSKLLTPLGIILPH